MISLRTVVFLICVAFLLPSTVWAFDDDEMVFDVDDIDDFEDDDAMTFAPDDFDGDSFDAEDSTKALDVGVVVVPGGALSDQQRAELQRILLEAVRNVPNISVYGDSDLLPALIDRDPDYCSREALCLAGVGRAAGVQRIVQARVERVDGRYRFDLDYFDVGDRLFVSYFSRSNLASVSAIHDQVQPGVNDIFNIRERRRRNDGHVEADVNVSRVMAYTSGGLSVVALGMGAFFGHRVRTGHAELAEFRRDEDGRFIDLTQREAANRLRDLETNALSANFSLGIGSALAVTSIVLFVLSSGGDDGAQASTDAPTPWYRAVQVTPQFDDKSVGFGASWNF